MTLKVPLRIGDLQFARIMGNTSILPRNKPNADYEDVAVSATTVDEELVSQRLPRPMAMWIDVEGAGYEVLKGADRALLHTSVIFIEVEDHSFWKGQLTAPGVVTYLCDRGFLPIARDFEYDGQYNIIFARHSCLGNSHIRAALPKYFSKQTSSQR